MMNDSETQCILFAERLALGENSLTGTIPAEFASLTNMQAMQVGINNLDAQDLNGILGCPDRVWGDRVSLDKTSHCDPFTITCTDIRILECN